MNLKTNFIHVPVDSVFFPSAVKAANQMRTRKVLFKYI